jgi:hypothetical protein
MNVLPNGGAALGTITVPGGSATGIYSFTFTNPGSDTRLDFQVQWTGAGGSSPNIYGITVTMS